MFFKKVYEKYQKVSGKCQKVSGKSLTKNFINIYLNSVSAFFLLITALLFFHPVQSKAADLPPQPAAKQELRQSAEDQTVTLVKMIKAYQNAKGQHKINLLEKLVEKAEERQASLSEMAQSDPAGARRVTLPARLQADIPPELENFMEQQGAFEGQLIVYEEDGNDGSHRRYYTVMTGSARFELKLAEPNDQRLQSGMPVRVRGWLFRHGGETDGTLVLDDSEESLQILADGSDTTTTSTSSSSTLPNTIGQQNVLVVMLNFQDNPVQPWTQEEVQDMVFNTVNGFYQETSHGLTWLEGDVVGYYTLPINTTSDCTAIHLNAQQAVEDSGVDVTLYNRMVYLFPKDSSCGWTGKATVGGDPSRAWINGALELRTIGHELGHNLGLLHAKRLECGPNTITGDCYTVEYGDGLDIMGTPGFTGHFNAFNKNLLGWLVEDPSIDVGQVATVESDGSYQLEPYETVPGEAPKALKILRGVDSVSGEQLWYYLEYRQPLGFDNYLADYPAISQGIVFHLATENDTNSSQWIDMTPASASADWNDAVLPVSSDYVDPDAGITVTTEWADASGAGVYVTYAEQSCISANPSISITPSESVWSEAGTQVTYTATITNNDSFSCESPDFNVAAEVPSGWSGSSATVNLEPGASAAIELQITSEDTAEDGFYDIPFVAVNSLNASLSATGVATYVVDSPDPVCIAASPLLVLDGAEGPAVEPGTSVNYMATVTNRDSSECAAAQFQIDAIVPKDWSASSAGLSLSPGESATVTISVASALDAADGTYSLDVNAENVADSAYSATSAASYAVANTPVCEPAVPLLVMTVNDSGEVSPGTTVQYTGTLTNQDSSDCNAADFTVSAGVPTGWSAATQNVNVAPGATAAFTLNVTSAPDAPEGGYVITINAVNAADSGYGSSTTVNYQVVAPVENSAPSAVDDSVGITAKDPVGIDVLANDSDPEGDVLTVSQVTQGRLGSVQITGDGTLLYTPDKSFKGSDSFTYTVSDGNKSATATVTVTLEKKNSK